MSYRSPSSTVGAARAFGGMSIRSLSSTGRQDARSCARARPTCMAPSYQTASWPLHTSALHTQPFHTQPLIREPFTRSPSTRNPSHLRTSRFTLSRRYGAPEWARGADGSEGPVEFDRVSVRALHTSTLPEDSFLFQQEKCTHPGHISHSYFTPHTLSHCTPHFTLHVTPHTARHTSHCASHFTLHAMSIGDFELNETISGWSYMHALLHAYSPTCILSYMHALLHACPPTCILSYMHRSTSS